MDVLSTSFLKNIKNIVSTAIKTGSFLNEQILSSEVIYSSKQLPIYSTYTRTFQSESTYVYSKTLYHMYTKIF